MNNNSKIFKIIEKYRDEYIHKITFFMDSFTTESLTTQTNIVSHDFFEGENGTLKSFGSPTILFNDLKKSTELMEELEDRGKLHYYSYYMYYSSKMLSAILDEFDGKIVECTGDGHYSILFFDKENISSLLANYNKLLAYTKASEEFSVCKKKLILNDGYQYIKEFDRDEIIFLKNNIKNKDELLRQLFFCIFAYFNIEINKLLPEDMSKKFLMKIGCATGKCQIMRIENTHIRQDKLIGSVVHKSAHQASGKI